MSSPQHLGITSAVVTNPTVLVVGAGASIPYSYPSGEALVDQILSKLGDTDSLAYEQVEALGFEKSELKMFLAELQRSRLYSIDAFLEQRAKFGRIGKVAIASVLLPYENVTDLMRRSDWYRYLHNALVSNLKRGAKAKLTIVTYNYDRSLEHYLYTALQNSFGYAYDEMTELMKNLTFVHVHGALCQLPWQTRDPALTRRYGDDFTASHVKRSADQIVIIHEGSPDSPNYAVARQAVRSAHSVCFLGFGYHHTNLERLLNGQHSHELQIIHGEPRQKFFGSAFGLTVAEAEFKTDDIKDVDHLFAVGSVHLDCHQFLRNNPQLLS